MVARKQSNTSLLLAVVAPDHTVARAAEQAVIARMYRAIQAVEAHRQKVHCPLLREHTQSLLAAVGLERHQLATHSLEVDQERTQR
jgi:hypothetical protein